MKKNIAMWSCPRSRSTLIFRSFEQRDDCITMDEPFYPPYLLDHGLDHPYRDEFIKNKETDYKVVIDEVTADLPENKRFSFQKHIAKNILPEYGRNWLADMQHVFLIRPANEVIASYHKVNDKVDMHDTGFQELLAIFKEVKSINDQTPIVIDSNHFLEDPDANLKLLCSRLDIPFSQSMLSWKSGIDDSTIIVGGTDNLPNPANVWHSSLMNSTGFKPYTPKEINLPEKFMALEHQCHLIYDELYQYCLNK